MKTQTVLTIDDLLAICDDTDGDIRMDDDNRIYRQRDPGDPWVCCGQLRNDQDSLVARGIVEEVSEMRNS